MTIRGKVSVGQQWQSNDPRRTLTVVRVDRIVSHETGEDVLHSFCDGANEVEAEDLVHVSNIFTGKKSTIRRVNFATGTRGWTLFKERV